MTRAKGQRRPGVARGAQGPQDTAYSGIRGARERGSAPDDRPLILTLQVDEGLANHFQQMRSEYFPPSIDRTPAHLTLFHQLPGDRHEAIVEIIATVGVRAAFPVAVTGLMPLGRGVAYRVEAPSLLALRKDLATRFSSWLTGQDRERFRPHVTIQNKVTPAEARRTMRTLLASFEPFGGWAEGLQLWRYDGGPWVPAGALGFHPAPDFRR